MRHARIVELARSFDPLLTLDLGCSLGQLTSYLAGLPGQLVAADLSPTAVSRARQNVRAIDGDAVEFVAARSLELPFANESFDLVIASDGLYSWDLASQQRAASLVEIHRVLTSRGVVILTDHMRQSRFAEFVDEVERSPLRIESVSYLYDRVAYQFESWLKGVQGFTAAKALKRSTDVAMVLSRVGRVFGQRGARHICVIARKN